MLQENVTHDLIYFTEIGIGTPPQRFQVLIDISSPETFVSSAECSACASGDVRYNSSRSCSSKVDGTALEVDYGYIFASGNMTIDTFDFGGVQVKDQPFMEATTVEPIGLSWDDLTIIHGIAGLMPSSAGSILNNSSPFMSMVKEHILDRNLFSLRLREPRELIFGAIDPELFTGDLVQIPLTNKTGRYALTGAWQAEAHYLTLGDEPGIRMSLAGYTASFSTRSAFLFLPDRMVVDIWQVLQFEEIMFLPPSVACEQRGIMPDFTFNLAGQNFTLTPYDYTFEWPIEQAKTLCVSAIFPFGVEQYDEIVLGSAFLRAFYSVFDLDSNTLGCKSALLHVALYHRWVFTKPIQSLPYLFRLESETTNVLQGRDFYQQARFELSTRPTVISFDANATAYVSLTTSQTFPPFAI